jgi:catechol 2,3-dioxygenase-like lactoylglutathione lyase family enzyme
VKVLELSWLGLVTADLERDRDFYTGVLGMSCTVQTETFAVLTAANGDVLELFRDTDPDHRHFPAGPVPGLRVDDLDGAIAEIAAAGAALVGEIGHGSRGNRWAHFRALDGTMFELLETGAG